MSRIVYFITALVSACVLVANGGEVTYFDLTGNDELISLTVTGCNRKICEIRNGRNYTVTATFLANQNSYNPQLTAQFYLNGTLISTTEFESNGCVGLKPSCPIRRGRIYSISRTWSVTGVIPGTLPIGIGTMYGDSGRALESGAAKYTIVA